MIFGKHINRYYLRYLPVLLLGTLALVAVDYFQLKIPELYRMLINAAAGEPILVDGAPVAFDLDFLLERICLPMIGVLVVMVIGRFLWRICFYGTAVRMETDLRARMFDRSADLSHEYYQENKVGTLMSLYTNDLDTIQECFGDGVLMFFDALFLGVLALVKMWRMNRLLTVLSLIPMAFLIVIGAIVGRRMMKRWEERQAAFSELSDFAQESFSGIAVIKAFVKEVKELLAFRKLNKKNEDANVEYTKISTLLNIFVTLFVESVICVILGYGGYLVYNKTFNAGELMEYIGYFNAIVWPIMAISMLVEQGARGRASLRRVSELLDAPVTVHDAEGAMPLTDARGEIEMRDLTFRYPKGEFDALSHVSFHIAAGETVGIVGKTGAGKTTLVDLLLRIYNVPDGTVFFDGRDVNSLTIRSVRDACAYVPQDNFLFSETIEKNIAFSEDTPNREDVIRAAKLADVDENITQFHDGYDTVLGERGVTVSGGQKQRISIARALMRGAPVLILDDAVSAVDSRTEKAILENLAACRKGKTTLMIAHRISTVEGADKILFLDDGTVADVGRHEELYARCEAYRKMVDLQLLEAQDGGESHA